MKQPYKLDSRKLERKFVRFLLKKKAFLTVTGKENALVDVNRNSLVIQASHSQKPWAISRKKLRQSICCLPKENCDKKRVRKVFRFFFKHVRNII